MKIIKCNIRAERKVIRALLDKLNQSYAFYGDKRKNHRRHAVKSIAYSASLNNYKQVHALLNELGINGWEVYHKMNCGAWGSEMIGLVKRTPL